MWIYNRFYFTYPPFGCNRCMTHTVWPSQLTDGDNNWQAVHLRDWKLPKYDLQIQYAWIHDFFVTIKRTSKHVGKVRWRIKNPRKVSTKPISQVNHSHDLSTHGQRVIGLKEPPSNFRQGPWDSQVGSHFSSVFILWLKIVNLFLGKKRRNCLNLDFKKLENTRP